MQVSIQIRYLYDFLFYLCLNLIMLNVVFGIIIDTFGEMRAARVENRRDTTENCFICSIDKEFFDRQKAEGFNRHIREDHNMWNYLYFYFHIMEQDKDDDDGLEYYIRHCMESQDLSWFPIKKATCLDLAESDEEILRRNLSQEVLGTEKTLEHGIDAFKESLKSSIGDILHQAISGHNNLVMHELAITDFASQDIDLGALKNISLQIVKITNLNLKPEELKRIHCRVVSGAAFFSSSVLKVMDGVLKFQDTVFLVAEAESIDSVKNLRIQILLGDSKKAGSAMTFLATLEVPLRMLFDADGLNMEIAFNLKGEEEPGLLVLCPTCVSVPDQAG
jgi:hypothetical protein